MTTKLYYREWDNRDKQIVNTCVNKKVLDIGIVGINEKSQESDDWLHGKIKKVASELVGIDIDKKSIDILAAKGYNVKYADCEDFNLNDKFEVIVAGELIEHLNNVGKFLESVKRHMNNESLFVLTTPNSVSFYNFANMLWFGRLPCNNKEHTHWHNIHTIKRALENHGFEISEISYIIPHAESAGIGIFQNIVKETICLIHVIVCFINKNFGHTLFIRSVLKRNDR